VVEIAAITYADDKADIRLLKDGQRYEVFAGDTHIGHLNMQLASENAQRLASNEVAFKRSVILTLTKEMATVQSTGQTTEDLDAFGLVLSKVEVPLEGAATSVVSEYMKEMETASASLVEEELEARMKSIEIAMAGINKGVIEGPNFVTAIAKAFKKFGIANPVQEAAAVVQSVSDKFIKFALEKSKEITEQGPDFARGMSQIIARAEHSSVVNTEDDISQITASAFSDTPTPVRQPVKQVELAAVTDAATKYRSMFKSF